MTDTQEAIRQLRRATNAEVKNDESIMPYDKIRIFDGDGDGVYISQTEIPDGWEIRHLNVSGDSTHVVLYEQE